MNNLAGTLINGYELLQYIGSGGYGVVYRAYQHTIGREVAMKIILPTFANEPDFIRRFKPEAQIIAGLEHPHIAPLHDYWRSQDGAYLVMRLLRGGSLQDTLANQPYNLHAAARLLDQISMALSTAHRNHVIHGNLKPSNILLDEDGNAYVSDFDIAREASQRISGAAFTPQTDIYSLGLVFYEVLTGQHPFPGSTVHERLLEHPNELLPPISNLLSDTAEQVTAILRKATDLDPAQRYRDVLDMAAAFREAAGIHYVAPAGQVVEKLTIREQEVLQRMIAGQQNQQIAQALVVTPATVKWHIRQIYSKLNVRNRVQAIVRARELNLVTLDDVVKPDRRETDLAALTVFTPKNPYKGLFAFQSKDADDFFGREALTERLIQRMGENVESRRFLAVVGPSGSGKSSLVKAGLIPMIWRGALPGSERWYVVEMLPGSQPLNELEVALMRVAGVQPANLHEQLMQDERGLIRAAQLILPNDDSELVLIIDQFEEVFTLTGDEQLRTSFLDLLYAAVTDVRCRVRVILTLRADFYDRPLRYPKFGELVRNRMETVLPLSAEELERAIVRPAEQVGVTFEPGLVASIIAEVNYQPGALPLLQYALTELFDRREDRVLTQAAYTAIGGTVGALARRADEVYLALDRESQQAARQLFLRLVALGDGSEDTGRRVQRSELMAITLEDTLDELIDSYAEYRLLSLDHDPATRSPTVELAHESILRAWQRLRIWLNESREDLRVHRRLSAATGEWIQSRRSSDLLALGTRLDLFTAWAQKTSLVLNADEQSYLDASLVNRSQQVALEDEREARAKAMRQRISSFRQAAAVLAIVGILAVAAAIVAVLQANIATNQMTAAAATLTVVARKIDSVDLGAAAVAELQKPLGNDTFAALLAIRSLKHQYYSVADQALMAAASNLPIRSFLGHKDEVRSVVFSKDGSKLLTASTDHTAILWDFATGRVIRTFVGHTDQVNSAVFSPDERYVLTASDDFTVRLWETATGKEVRKLTDHTDVVFRAVFSHDGKYILSGSADKNAILWDAASGQIIRKLAPLDATIYAIAFSHDDKMIATTFDSYNVKLWETATGKEIHILKGQTNSVWALVFSPDDKLLLSAGLDDTARIWDVATGQMLRTLAGHSSSVRAIAFSPDGKLVLTGSRDSTARLWNVETGQLIRVLRDHLGAVYGASFSPDGKYIITASADNTLKLWEINTGLEARTLRGHTKAVYGIAVSPDGKMIASASEDGTVRLWDVATGETLHVLEGHSADVYSVAFSPDGKLLLSSSFDHTAKLWEVSTGREIRTFKGHAGLVLKSAFSPDGKTIVTASSDHTAQLWSVADGQALHTFTGHPDQIWAAVFSPDGKTIATASTDNTIRLWNVSSGTVNHILSGHTDGVYSVAFSPDGKTVVSGSRDRTAKLWAVATGQLLRTFTGHSGTVDDVAFSPDGKLLVTGGADQTVRLWDVATGNQLRVLRGHTDAVWGVTFSPDSKHVFTGSLDTTIRVWDTDYRDFIASVCSHLLRDFSEEERQQIQFTNSEATCSQR